MTERCPSELALEAHILSHGNAPCSKHVQECDNCQARLARMEEEGRDFKAHVYPATIDNVLRVRSRGPATWLRAGFWLAPALGVGFAVLLMVREPQPSSNYLGIKGRPIDFAAFVNELGVAKAISDGAVIAANAELRFKVRMANACRLWIISIDSSQVVSRLFPVNGPDGALVSGSMTLPGGAVLDGKEGPERLFAICSPNPLSFDEVVRTARSAIPPGARSIRQEASIAGLPPGTLQASLLLEKELPRP